MEYILRKWAAICSSKFRRQRGRAGRRRTRWHFDGVPAACCLIEDLETRVLLSQVGSVTVAAQVGTLTYGTAGSATYLVTVDRGNTAGAFNADLSLTTALPSGVSAVFDSTSLSFGAGDNSLSTTLTISTLSTAKATASPFSFTVKTQVDVNASDSATGDGSLTINRLALTGTITASNKPYDGSTNALFITNALTGLIAGDDVQYLASGQFASFDTKNIGTGKTVTAINLHLSGADAGNYSVNSTATTTADITPISLTAVVTVAPKDYDGTTSATLLSKSLTGVLSGETVDVTGGTAAFDTKTAGAVKSATITGLTLTGADSGNYVIATPVTTTAAINTIVLGATITASNKPYDGTTAATIIGRTVVGAISGDDVSLSGGTATFNNKNVGTGKTVSATGLVLGGADQANYTFAGTGQGTADITPLALVASFTAANKVYDGTTTATIATRSLTGVLAGDVVNASGGTATFDTKNVGTAKVVTATGLGLSGADAGNYSVNSTATATADVTRAVLTVTADDKTITPGDPLPALTASFSGFVDGETLATSGVAGSPSLSTTATAASPIGDYPITIAAGTLTAGNYTFTFTNGTFSIVTPTDVFVTALGGLVSLFGDPAKHTIDVSFGSGNLKLTGSLGTRFTFNGVTHSVLDIPFSNSAPLTGLFFAMAGGDDTITIDGSGLATFAGNIVAHLGEGNNSFVLINATVAGDVNVFGGNEGNAVTLTSDTVRNATILTGSGMDSVALTGVKLQSAPVVPGVPALSFLTHGASLIVNTGAGDDTIDLDNVTGTSSLIGGWWLISSGAFGDDAISLKSVTNPGLTVVTGSLDTNTIAADGSSFGLTTVFVAGGLVQNTVQVTSSTFAGPAVLVAAGGTSPLISVDNSKFNSVTVFVAVGKDAQVKVQTSSGGGSGTTFQGLVVGVVAGSSAKMTVGNPAASGPVSFGGPTIFVGDPAFVGDPSTESTFEVASSVSTLDSKKLFLVYAKRKNV